MASIEKRLNKALLKKASVWGTEVDGNVAGTGILALNAGAPKLAIAMIEDESYGAFESDLTVGNFGPADFGLDFDFRYDGLENILLAMLLGTAGTPTQLSGAAWKHTLVLKESVSGLFVTYAVEKGSLLHIVPTAKVLKGAFSMSNGLIKASFNLRGNKLVDTSSILTSMSAVTVPTNKHHRAKFNQAVFWMDAQTAGDALDATNLVSPKSFSLEIERKVDAEHVAGSSYIVEPRENDKPSVKLMMEFPRMDTGNAAYFAEWSAATEKKLLLTITGPLIASTYYYTLQFVFPRLIIEDVEYADSKIIPAKISLRGVTADTAPTGMTETNPVTVYLTNTRVTDLLA